MPFQFTQNGQTFQTSTDDPTEAAADQQAFLDASKPDLPELFRTPNSLVEQGGSPTGLVSPEMASNLRPWLAITNTANEQLGVIKKAMPDLPDGDIELDDEGRLILTVRNPADPTQFDRGYVNAPGPSQMDVSEAVMKTGLFLPSAMAGGLVTKGPRMLVNLLARMATTSVAAGASEAMRQHVVKSIAAENYAPDVEENGMQIGLAASLGVAGELIGPVASFMQRFVRNKLNVSGAASLTDHGKEILKRIGIDPQMVEGDTRFFQEFRKSAGMSHTAMGESLVRTRPDLVARLALEGRNFPVGAAGTSFKTVLDEHTARVDDATLQMAEAVAKTGKLSSTFNPSVADGMVNLVQSDLMKGGALYDPTVRAEMKNFGNIFRAGKRQKTVIKVGDIEGIGNSETFNPLDINPRARAKVTESAGPKSAAEAINDYVGWAQGIRNRIAKGTLNDQNTGRGLKQLLDTTDDIVNQTTLNLMVKAKPEEIANIGNVLKLSKEFKDTFTVGNLMNDVLVNQRTPEESVRMLFGASKLTTNGSAVQALQGLKSIFGPNSMEWVSMQDEALRLLLDQGGGQFSRKTLESSFRNALENQPTLMNTMFDQKDLTNISSILGATKGSNLTKVLGDIMTVRYGVHGAAIAGSIRRLGTLEDQLTTARRRPLWSDTAVLMLTTNANSISKMYGGAQGVWDGLKNLTYAVAQDLDLAAKPEPKQKTERVVPKKAWFNPSKTAN